MIIQYPGFTTFTKKITEEDKEDTTIKFYPNENKIELNATLNKIKQEFNPDPANSYISIDSTTNTGPPLKK